LQFKQCAKNIKDLLWVHNIVMSETECMVKWLWFIQEEGGEYFEDEASEWKDKITHNSFFQVQGLLHRPCQRDT
jgi:hypothetical protein